MHAHACVCECAHVYVCVCALTCAVAKGTIHMPRECSPSATMKPQCGPSDHFAATPSADTARCRPHACGGALTPSACPLTSLSSLYPRELFPITLLM